VTGQVSHPYKTAGSISFRFILVLTFIYMKHKAREENLTFIRRVINFVKYEFN